MQKILHRMLLGAATANRMKSRVLQEPGTAYPMSERLNGFRQLEPTFNSQSSSNRVIVDVSASAFTKDGERNG